MRKIKILAVRHGQPVDVSFFHKKKKLSLEGVKSIQSLSSKLKYEGVVPKIIYTSPKLRAKETAQILSDNLSGHIFEEHALAEPFDEEKLLDIIENSQEEEITIFFVGHAPTLAQFVEDLVGENVLPEGLCKGCAALVVFENSVELGKGKFEKIFHP